MAWSHACLLAVVTVVAVACGGAPAAPGVTGSGSAEARNAETSVSSPTHPAPRSADPPAPIPPISPASPPVPASPPTIEPVLVPLVPVTGFWSTERSVSKAGLASALAGTSARPGVVMVDRGALAAVASSLGVKPGPHVRAMAPDEVRAAIARDGRIIGLLRAEDVTADVRALAVDDIELFGGSRVRDLSGWPLLVPVVGAAAPSTFDPAAAWTLAAGGDVMLDRDVYRLAVIRGRGPDWPWSGGTARITGRTCCGWMGMALVAGRRTGHAGAVRDLLHGADVALVNLEGPAPRSFSYHPNGHVFTMDPGLLVGLRRAGIDVVSLGNNHIANAGPTGVRDTTRRLDRLGIVHAGAGQNLGAARRPAWLSAGGLRIAVLAADDVARRARATRSRAGSAPLRTVSLRADIRAARQAGADVVIVAPHWGREYTDTVTPRQRRVARALLDAGADVVLGSHSHWAGPLDIVDGRLVVYSLGNLVFDLQHDARTQQGLIVVLTFVGRRLAQVDLHPTLMLRESQPNLLEPHGGGNALLRAIREGSVRAVR